MTFSIPQLSPEFLSAAAPILILCVVSIIHMLQAVFKSFSGERAVFSLLLTGLLVAIISACMTGPKVETAYLDGSYLGGDLSRFGQIVILGLATVVTLLFHETYLKSHFFRGEIASLFAMIVAGMLVMVTSEEMVTLFVGLELSSIGLYAVVGYLNPTRRSQEGAIKYFILGSFAAALLLFGFGLLYAATGSMRLSEIVEVIPKMADHNWVRLGVLFTLVGLGFKLALAPFHLWAPDTYEAAPTGITAFMATSVKVMILVVAVRLFGSSLASTYEVWLPALMFLAMVSMLLGNVMALVQTSMKRMLAYSSIAHSGYMAIAICAAGGSSAEFPVAAILYYVLGYAIVSLGAFGVLMYLEGEGRENLILDDLAGLSKSHPWAAFGLACFMFSFAGMPPTVGFIGKLFVFKAAIDSQLYGLVVIAAIGSAISLYYYLRVIVKMYMSQPIVVGEGLNPQRSVLASIMLACALILAFLMGTVLPGPVFRVLVSASQEVANN
jgi:NADH-quinone oxidoreductase subunit N